VQVHCAICTFEEGIEPFLFFLQRHGLFGIPFFFLQATQTISFGQFANVLDLPHIGGANSIRVGHRRFDLNYFFMVFGFRASGCRSDLPPNYPNKMTEIQTN